MPRVARGEATAVLACACEAVVSAACSFLSFLVRQHSNNSASVQSMSPISMLEKKPNVRR